MAGRGRGRNPRGAAAYEQMVADTRAVQLRVRGMTISEIAEETNSAASTVSERIRRAIAAVPVEAVTELRQIQLARFDFQRRMAMRLLVQDFPLIQNGRVIMVEKEQEDGRMVSEPVVDVGPKFRALAELRKIEDSITILCGTGSPKRIEMNVVTEDVVDAEIKRLEYELGVAAGRGVAGEAALPTGTPTTEG